MGSNFTYEICEKKNFINLSEISIELHEVKIYITQHPTSS